MNIDVYLNKYREELKSATAALETTKKEDKGGGGGVGPFSAAPKYEQLAKALSFMCHVVQESERGGGKGNNGGEHPLDYLKVNQIGCEAGIKCEFHNLYSCGVPFVDV